MKILILNWRDIKNPAAGGAEILTHEMAKRWVKLENDVVLISAGFPGAKNQEIIDGVRIIRMGKWWNVHLLACFYYFKNLRNKIDIIIDEVHWFPFFARLYAGKKTILLACEVANKLFYKCFPWPLAITGRLLEKIYLFLYRNTPTLAISSSTKNDLIKEGFQERNITVLPMGVSCPKEIKIYTKEKRPTIIYLGRINKQKGADDAIEVFKEVKKKIVDAEMWFVGTSKPEYLKRLKKKIANYGFKNTIKFFGFVSSKEKFRLLSQAHILIVPSAHEGWGLVVTEAGLVGTPAVVYNVAGLRDIVKNNINGLVVELNPQAMATGVIKLLSNKEMFKDLQKNAIKIARSYNWETTAALALKELQKFKKND